LTQGRTMSEAVMIALAKKGVNRQEAHELLRKLTIKSETERRDFKKILLENKLVSGRLTEKELGDTLNPKNYLGTAKEQVAQIVKKTIKERKARGLT